MSSLRRPWTWLVAAGVAALIAAALFAARPRVPDGAVLVLELGGEIEDAPPRDLLAQWTARGPALPTILLLLDMAAVDERVQAVLVEIEPLAVGYARLQELRDALGRVREAGKPVIAHLDATSLNATRELFLASAANKVFVDPTSLSPLAGIAGQYLHFAGLFEKLGVEWQVAKVGEYKSAAEQFSARRMSPEAREMTDALLDGLFAQIVDGIAAGRGLSSARVRELVDAAPGTAEELVAAGLADGIADRHEVLGKAGISGAPDAEVRSAEYQRVDPRTLGLRNGPAIGLIFGDGTILDERGRGLSRTFAADETSEALDAAAEDDSIRAVVLRVNSPGGSAQASDEIWRAVRRTREKKPVVVSMGEYAASGGYYVASAANAVVSEPATLTGSIGVYLLRPSFAGVFDKLEIGAEVIARGAYAPVASSGEPYTAEQHARTEEFVKAAYGDFIDRVSTGRGLERDAVDQVGRGRVWLGSDALARKLVDELGGLRAAVERARLEAGIADEPDPARVILPAQKSTGEQVRELLRGDIRGRLLAALLPDGLPFALGWLPLQGQLAYLPGDWLEIR
jgi:protease-4